MSDDTEATDQRDRLLAVAEAAQALQDTLSAYERGDCSRSAITVARGHLADALAAVKDDAARADARERADALRAMANAAVTWHNALTLCAERPLDDNAQLVADEAHDVLRAAVRRMEGDR